MHRVLVCSLVLACRLRARRRAGAESGERSQSLTIVIDGSPAPEPPETITRDARGRATVRAIKLTEPLRLDGKLDEEVYQTTKPFGGFLQVAPKYGAGVHREDRRLDHLRPGQHLRLGSLLGLGAAGAVDRERAAPRHQSAAPERSLRRDVRHVLRSPQRVHVLHQPARRAGRLLGRRRRAVEHRLESGLGARTPAPSTAAGRSRWRFRSRRCATALGPIRSGAFSCAARFATRTSGRI